MQLSQCFPQCVLVLLEELVLFEQKSVFDVFQKKTVHASAHSSVPEVSRPLESLVLKNFVQSLLDGNILKCPTTKLHSRGRNVVEVVPQIALNSPRCLKEVKRFTDVVVKVSQAGENGVSCVFRDVVLTQD